MGNKIGVKEQLRERAEELAREEDRRDGIPGPEPASIAAPNPDLEALARRVASPLKPAEPTEAQRMLERTLACRNSLLEAAVSLEKTLGSIRGRQERPEVVSEPPARAQTGFFVALGRLVDDLELTAKRIGEQAEELRGRF